MKTFKTETLSSWEDIKKFAKPLWLFRGQRSAKWELETSFERWCKRQQVADKKRPETEDRLVREFRRAYHLFAQHVPEPGSVIEWLSLMQHHGAPTRLLDFTYSVYVATYFATEAADDDSAVWALDGKWALAQAAKLLRAAGKRGAALRWMEKGKRFKAGYEQAASDLFLGRPHVRACWPTNPFRLNGRLVIQRGAFVIPGDVRTSFMANLEALTMHRGGDHFLKIIIPNKEAQKAQRELFSMGISRASLFPGLDGFAQSLAGWHPVLDPSEWAQGA